jgi:signal transduction histidine kinase
MRLSSKIAHLGIVKGSLIFTAFCILFSFALYLVTAYFTASIRPIGIFVSLLTPALAAPPVCIILLYLNRILYGTQKELLKFQQTLEEKILERTQELLRANEELRHSENLLKTVMELLPVGVWIQNSKGEIVSVNTAGRNIWAGACHAGIEQFGEYKGWWLESGKMIEPHEWAAARAIEKGETSLNKEIEIECFNGEHKIILNSALPLQERDGKIKGAVIINQDITERKLMETERLRTQKIESLGILAGGIAHDFNNLMTVVMGNIELAIMGLPVNHRSYTFLETALQSAGQTKDLTSRFLTFSIGGISVKEVTDVSEIIRETIQERAGRTSVQTVIHIAKELPMVKVDKAQIRQVFYNLIANAIEVMPDGGTLTVEAENREIHDTDNLPLREGSYLRIVFADTGKGIPEEHLSRIFDPYFTTKDMGSQSGTGLGLSVCYSILKKHDGYITAVSPQGKGAAFTLYLPALAEEVAKAVPAPSSRPRILIMEDGVQVRKMERDFLEKLGYEVTETGDGQEALECYKEALLSKRPFDLVILDLIIRQGPGGILTMEKLLKEDPSVKAIVVSGYVNDPAMEDCRNYGFRGALKKPFNLMDFQKLVETVINT